VLPVSTTGAAPISRLLILALIALTLAVAVLAARLWAGRQVSRLRERPLWNALGLAPDGQALVVAFSTASCGVCKSAQKPALRRLQTALSDIRVLEIDAGERPEVAGAFGVVTVPTTVVFGRSGEVVAANHGFAPWKRLLAQIEGSATAPSSRGVAIRL